MVIAAYVRLLFDYHDWARDRVLAAVTALTPERNVRAFVNTFDAPYFRTLPS